jgi:hydroxymethylpyrimidine/phosphomethylpyrimidine kinase
VTLTIAGSDNSGGAGLQADLKTFTLWGTYGTVAVTAIVAEHPGKVERIQKLPASLVSTQVRLTFEAFPVAAVKTGMLPTRAVILAVAKSLGQAPQVPLVVDPVMVASTGDALIDPSAVSAMAERLLPMAMVATPNRDEAARLWGRPIRDHRQLEQAGRELSRRFGCAMLVKGGHLGGAKAVDLLCSRGELLRRFTAPMIAGVNPHGTGCTLSAALTAGLAHGLSLVEAADRAKEFVTRAIRQRLRYGAHDLLRTVPLHSFASQGQRLR